MIKKVMAFFLVCALVVGLLPAVPMAAVAAAGDVEIKEANFPDANFRAYVKETFDTDANGGMANDGILTAAEIGKITGIICYYRGIKSLKGIEHFTALTDLNCCGNQLTSLDVSKNTALTLLKCGENQLTSLDVSKNTALETLWCSDNQLTSLDVSKHTALTDLGCSGNQLTSLDVSKNTVLKKLSCSETQLTSLDVSKNTALTELICPSSQLTSLDVSKNTALTSLLCGENQLTSLDVSKNTALTSLLCGENQLTSLDVSKNTALTVLYCYENQLTSLDVSKNTKLETLRCNKNKLTSLDVSKNTALEELYCFYNQLTSLDVKNMALETLWCDNNQLTSLDVSKNMALETLWCTDNQLTSLDVSKNMALRHLQCNDNQLTSLDVSKNTALTSLGCGGNQLTSLDVSKNTALWGLECNDNPLTSLNLRQNTKLEYLDVGEDKIDNVDLSQNILLRELGIYGDLDLVQQKDGTWQTNLSEIEKHVILPKDWFDHTKITSENIGKNTKWEFETIPNAKYDPNTGIATIPNVNELKIDVYQYKGGSYSLMIKISDEKRIYLYFNIKPDSSLQYDISVTGGKADMNKAAVGTKVTLTADPAPAGKVFDKWTVDGGSPEVTFADEYSENTTFTMPQGAVKVTATYKASTGAGTGTTGKILSYGDAAGTVTIELKNGVKKYSRTGTASYDLSGIPTGTYTMTVSKSNHATREYTIKLGSEALPDVAIYLLGDVDMNGKLNMLDIQKIFAFIKNSSSITDEYQKKLADVDENKDYNMLDIQRLFNAIKKA